MRGISANQPTRYASKYLKQPEKRQPRYVQSEDKIPHVPQLCRSRGLAWTSRVLHKVKALLQPATSIGDGLAEIKALRALWSSLPVLGRHGRRATKCEREQSPLRG